MDQKTALYTKLFLNHFTPGQAEGLLEYFPEGKEAVERIASLEDDISHAFKSTESMLAEVHYSWIADKLKETPREKTLFFLSSLPKETVDKLKPLIGIQDSVPQVQETARKFLRKELLKELLEEDHLPVAYTPKNSLKPLAALSKAKLVEVIDFLGLYDLAEEMKKIVDTHLLRKFSETLGKRQKAFIKECMQKKDVILAPPFPLYDWNGEAKELAKRLHKKGLIRLSKALSGEDPRFVWHITHKLDTGRGKLLESMISKDPVPKITEAMKGKTLTLISYLQKDNRSE